MTDHDMGWPTTAAAGLAGLSYRQVDHWVRCGAVVPTVDADGSGYRRGWSDLDVACLAAIGRVVADLQAIGLGQPVGVGVEFVGRLWALLRDQADVTITQGTVTIRAHRERRVP